MEDAKFAESEMREKEQRQMAEERLIEREDVFAVAPAHNPYEAVNREPNLQEQLFVGKVWQQVKGEWEATEQAELTAETFFNIKILGITKMKIKAQSEVKGTRLIKISTHHQDFFFSVMAQEQIEWMTRILWAKMASMNRVISVTETFQGAIDGEILKRGFFGGWERKIGVINGFEFKILSEINAAPEVTIAVVPEIWTRFEIVEGDNVVIKMHHGVWKLEIAVPMDQCLFWMRGLFQLVK
jgi:hypothetical protein